MKKCIVFVFTILSLGLLAACGSGTTDVMRYVDVTFEGEDGKGMASYDVDLEGLYKDAFDLDSSMDDADPETQKEIMQTEAAYEVSFDPAYELSNGDKITVTIDVDEDKTDKLKGGEKEVTVEGLE